MFVLSLLSFVLPGCLNKQHLVIETSHPSPLGATKTASPFLGSKCFTVANDYLEAHGKAKIDWNF